MERRYPDLKTRVQSMFIDGILLLLMMFAAAWVFDKIGIAEENEGWIKALVFVSIWAVYEPLSMTLGCTLGNYLMKIRVRDKGDPAKRINILQAYVRLIIKMLLGWLSFLTIHFNEERRAMHDLAANTIMIEK